MVVKAFDQASPTLGVVGRNLRGLFNMARMFNIAWNRGLPRLGGDVVKSARPALAALGAMRGEAMSLLRTVSAIALGAGGVGYAFKRLFVAGAVDAERFRLVLEGVEQSPGRAESAMHWISEFKRRTGFELKEIQQAWVDFRREGLNPISGSFNRIADAAAGNGQTFDRAASIWREALDGNVKGLDAWGITAEKVGDRIILKYNHLGQTIQKTVSANNKAAIAQALGGIINDRWEGFAARHAKTLPAMWSNAKQAFDDFALTVMNGGVFDAIKDILADLNAGAKEAAADGSLKRWAADMASGLKELVGALATAARWVRTTLPQWIDDFRDVKAALGGWRPILIAIAALLGIGLVTSVLKFVAALGPLVRAIAFLAAGGARIAVFMIPMLVSALATVSSFITATLIPVIFKLGAAFLATPVGWIVLALAAIGAAAYLLYENWNEVWRFLDTDTGQAVQVLLAVLAPLWYVPMRIIRSWEPLKAAFAEIWASITSGFDSAVAWIEKKWEQLVAIARSVRGFIDSVNPFGSGGSGDPGAPTIGRPAPVLGSAGGAAIGALRAPPQQVDGEIRIVVQAQDGTDAKVTGARASGGVDVTATLGQYGRFL